jgi:RHS repeat-associated protein
VRISYASGDPNEFIFNPAGQRASIWNPVAGTQVQGQAYWGSAMVEYYFGGNAHYQHHDWMGTERLQTNYAGTVEGSYASLPFGDGYQVIGVDEDPYHFATLDQDSSGAEHAEAREDSNTAGRWMSPDPYAGSYDATNPQSFNRYTYAANNPLSLIDPTGLATCQLPLTLNQTGDPCEGGSRLR